jgi:hypothetical protein
MIIEMPRIMALAMTVVILAYRDVIVAEKTKRRNA